MPEEAAMNPVLLILIAPPELEESLVDWLLARDELSGFTGQPAFGHSRAHGGFSLVEQVTGRQRRITYHVQTDEQTARTLLAALRADLAGAGIRYWLQPLIEAGRID